MIDPTARRRLGRTPIEVTRLGFGGAPLGNLLRPVAPEAARGAVQAAWAAGIRTFDTAPLYGKGLSERRLGEVLRAVPRDAFVLSTKVGRLLKPGARTSDGFVDAEPFEIVYDYGADGARRSLEGSLERLGLSRVDVLLVHDIDGFTHGPAQSARFAEAMAGAIPALLRMREEGTVGAVGLGVNEWQVCAAAAERADLDCFLLAGRYTLLEQEALETLLPLCERRGIGIILGGPFNSGILATGAVAGAPYNYAPAPAEVLARVARLEAACARHGVALAAAALQFPLAHPAVACTIPGARSAAEVAANLALLRAPIPPALWADLKREGLLRGDAPVPA